MSDTRRDGHSKLVYNKATRTIDTVDPHPTPAPPAAGLTADHDNIVLYAEYLSRFHGAEKEQWWILPLRIGNLARAYLEVDRLGEELSAKLRQVESAYEIQQAAIAAARAETITELEVYGPPPLDMHWKAFLAYFKRRIPIRESQP
jgi:hypothetical protein